MLTFFASGGVIAAERIAEQAMTPLGVRNLRGTELIKLS
jgi:hypothetical protein